MTLTALITGITGQDGSYLAELLLDKGYEVWGMVRRGSSTNTGRIDHLLNKSNGNRLNLISGNMIDGTRILSIIQQTQPDEIYNLAAQSFVPVSFNEPSLTTMVNAVGVTHVLEAARLLDKPVKVYQASSSEMFGKVEAVPQDESTKFHPRSPYGVTKVFGHYQTINYREAYGLYACSGILFNHESPRRGEEFVTRKITRAATRIKVGLQSSLRLGNLDAKRDWGYAAEYVHAMWLMLQQNEPDDYVIATGAQISVREFTEEVFSYLGLDWQEFVEYDADQLRPAEVESLLGDPSKAERKLGWSHQTDARGLARIMTESDLRLAERELAMRG
jgi:GDPmannose 4,6-dehydratase